MPVQGKVRLADIAKKLNVSTVTVSKAIADKDGVSEELREKIKQTAIEMGYRFKTAKKMLRIGHTGNIGVLIPNRFFEKKTSFYWILYNEVALSLMQSDYYCIMETLSYEDEVNHKLPRMIQENKVDGVIVLGQLNKDYIDYFVSQYETFLFLDFYSNHSECDSVVSDNFYCMYLLTRYLIEEGHKDIGFVGSYNATSSIQDRFMGYLKAMIEKNLPIRNECILEDRDNMGMRIDIEFPEKMPTAFVCNCDEIAAVVIQTLKSKNIVVPDDVSVVGFDNYQRIMLTEPEITTVEVDTTCLARTAVDIILKKVSGEPYNKGRNTIGGRIILKNSVKNINENL